VARSASLRLSRASYGRRLPGYAFQACDLVRAGSARLREPLVPGGHKRSRPVCHNRRSQGIQAKGLGRRNGAGPGSNPSSSAASRVQTAGPSGGIARKLARAWSLDLQARPAWRHADRLCHPAHSGVHHEWVRRVRELREGAGHSRLTPPAPAGAALRATTGGGRETTAASPRHRCRPRSMVRTRSARRRAQPVRGGRQWSSRSITNRSSAA
jgi:hypothetical protein